VIAVLVKRQLATGLAPVAVGLVEIKCDGAFAGDIHCVEQVSRQQWN
jgi:hypothetical protein